MDKKFQEAQLLSQQLQTDLYSSISLRNEMSAEISQQKKSLSELMNTNETLRQELQSLTLEHEESQMDLQKMTKCHIEVSMRFAEQQKHILKHYSTRLDLQMPLNPVDKEQLDSMKRQLRCADGCVDVLLKCPHGSAYFLRKIEQQLEAEYRATLQEKDDQIAALLKQSGNRSSMMNR
ncbi:hypothetical protein BGW36DRAFT_361352 [Talaromyces proteolyticus]|uniref:Uncharacterized protein n=1 Tax=Talaromyces proteolyticus TaxID=1131652 RepID=A0AAD4KS28_9EURO|nr:uncharacterized protein BGW36DRAFT_361352 [Talaromyces proteolyticus]KAH8695676.1 hypothetical protein BGW36DRAFT_361352 [Talaromyces proteolyticus]